MKTTAFAHSDISDPQFSGELFRNLIETAPYAMVIVDLSGDIVLVNAQTERLFGYTRAELLGEPVEILVPNRSKEGHGAYRTRYGVDPHVRPMGGGLELFGRRKDGSEFPVEISLSPQETARGTLVSSALRDISGRTRAEHDAAHFAAVVESSSDAIIGMTLEGVVVSWNLGAERLYGYPLDEMIGKSISVLVPPGHDYDLDDILSRVGSGERVDNVERVRARKDGTQVEVSLNVSPIRDKWGKVIGASTIARDVSAIVRYREQLRFLAEHDALTGTRNRWRFQHDVIEQVGRARRYGERAAVLIIDVNQFKKINDGYGHKAGDQALKAVAAGLRSRLRSTDVIARLGGDEFGVLLPYASREQAETIAADLRRVINETNVGMKAHGDVRLSVSIGVAFIDGHTANDEDILAAADHAMYEDKLRNGDSALGALPAPDACSDEHVVVRVVSGGRQFTVPPDDQPRDRMEVNEAQTNRGASR